MGGRGGLGPGGGRRGCRLGWACRRRPRGRRGDRDRPRGMPVYGQPRLLLRLAGRIWGCLARATGQEAGMCARGLGPVQPCGRGGTSPQQAGRRIQGRLGPVAPAGPGPCIGTPARIHAPHLAALVNYGAKLIKR